MVKNNPELIAIPAAIYFTNTDFSQIVFENNVFK